MKLFRPFDLLIILAILAGSVWFTGMRNSQTGTRAEVYVKGQKIAGYELDVAEQFAKIPTPIGTVKLQYGNGAIRVVKSPCTQKICILQGAIRHTDERIVCLPAQMQIIITENGNTSPEQQIDAYSY